MSASVVEHARALHEDLERHERAVCDVLDDKDDKDDDENNYNNSDSNRSKGDGRNINNNNSSNRKGYKEKLIQSHKVRKLLDVMQDRARKLRRIYQDDDGSLKEEIDLIAGNADNSDNNNDNNNNNNNNSNLSAAVNLFYDRVRDMKEFQQQRNMSVSNNNTNNNNEDTVDTSFGTYASAMIAMNQEDGYSNPLNNNSNNSKSLSRSEKKRMRKEAEEAAISTLFSGEELLGKCMDVHQLHDIFINASFCNKGKGTTNNNKSDKPVMTYLEYLNTCFGSVEGMRNCVTLEKKLKGSSVISKKNDITDNSNINKIDIINNLSHVTYAEYLERVEAYLVSFLERTQPLMDVKTKLKAAVEECTRDWNSNKGIVVQSWKKFILSDSQTSDHNKRSEQGKVNMTIPKSPIDLEAFSSSGELLDSVGVESITSALKEIGLKAGGSPAQRSERLFSIKGVTDSSKLNQKILASSSNRGGATKKSNLHTDKGKKGSENIEEKRERKLKIGKQIASIEAKVATMLEMNEIKEAVNSTLLNVERKQALTFEEMQAEALAGELEEDVELDSDDDDDIYNPLKLPLDWDGKPIPYWLYKLHGLNQEFRCEICGNTSYYGRRAFERHFSEQKHQAGLRALGIPPGKEFYEITEIQDALDLYQSMVQKGLVNKKGYVTSKAVLSKWDAADDEEFEDDEGNVYNRKTYDDLKRQGLI